MNILKCDSSKPGPDMDDACAMAAQQIRSGELIVYPTDTVYGIGASVYDTRAVTNLYRIKQRPFDMALSVAVADRDMVDEIAEVNESAEKLIEAFMPGPLTIIIHKTPRVPELVTACSDKIGFRIPDHPIAREIARQSGPIVATSANTHSKPDAVNIDMATAAFGENVSLYIDDGPSRGGKPSTIVWIKDKEIEIVRQGEITAKMITEVLNC